MPNVLEQGWVGRRVSVRRVAGRGAEGQLQFADVVGDLVRLQGHLAVIETRQGPVELDVSTIALARTAPPSTGEELALQAVMGAGWRPAETEPLGGWLLRANGGFTGRANSVLPLRAPGMPLDDALDRAGRWYAERGLPLVLMVPTEARRLLDAELGERGWPFEPDVHVMAARLDALPDPRPGAHPDTRVGIAPEADDAWFARYRDGAGADPTARALLTRHERAGFAAVRDGGEVVAIGRGVVDDGWLGIAAVEVAPAARRQGLATAVVRALWAWGRERGATRSYLQVSSDNPGAVELYRTLGYWLHHDYRYRRQPVG